MKKLTFLISAVAWLMAMPVMAAEGDEFPYGNLKFKVITETEEKKEVQVIRPDVALSGDVVIPDHVTNKDVEYSVASIKGGEIAGGCAFREMNDITSITIPYTVYSMEYSAFYHCEGLKAVYNNGNMDKINGWTFNGCTSLEYCRIPATITEIGSYAFYGCTNLSGIELPAVEKLKDHAFKESGLASIYLPSTINDLGTWTFEGCTALKYVKLPTSVTQIGDGVFYNCSGLEFITIPASVNRFGEDVFNGCTALQSFYYLGTSFPITFENGNLFYNIENGDDKRPKIYTKPGYVESMKTSLDGKCDWLKSFVFDAIPYTPAKEYTTFCRDFDVDFSAATGLKAGVATNDLNGTTLKLDVKESVPARTGVLLKGTAKATYTLKIAESAPAAIDGNKLIGVVVPTAIPQTDGGNTNFVLKDGVFKKVSDKNNTLPAGKAYLQLPTSEQPSAPSFTFSFEDDITGINMIKGDELKMNGYYNLAGQHVANPTKGLYIINGKKVVVK